MSDKVLCHDVFPQIEHINLQCFQCTEMHQKYIRNTISNAVRISKNSLIKMELFQNDRLT